MADIDLDQFLRAVFPSVNADEVVCLVDARPDPNGRVIFPARPWRPGRSRIQGSTYVCISTVKTADAGQKLQRTLSHVVRTFAVVLDDIGTKIDVKVFAGKASPHAVVETSPGNFQWWYLIEPSDPDQAAAVIHALALAEVTQYPTTDGQEWRGYTDKGAQGKNRVVRVPGSVNTKHGQKFPARVVEWYPDEPRWSLAELAAEFGVTPVADASGSSVNRVSYVGDETDDPVFQWLDQHGMVLGPPNQDGYASIICPWAHEHTDPREDARWAVGIGTTGAFKCFHAACVNRGTSAFLHWVEQEGGPDFHEIEVANAAELGALLLARASKRGRPARGAEKRPAPRENRPPDAIRPNGPTEPPPDVGALLTAILDDLPGMRRENLPTTERTAGGGIKMEQKPTAENVGFVAQSGGFTVRKNEMLGEIEIEHDDPRLDVLAPTDRTRIVRELLLSACQRLGMNARGVLQSSLDALASGHSYHPVVDWVLSAPWDGKDRMHALTATLKAREPAWAAIALKRWCIQAATAWTNWVCQPPLAVPYVLTLVGGQGIGKTSWFRSLLPDGLVQTEASLHLDSMRADDQKRKVLSSPIVELGEIETTFGRSEIGALKAFLSNTSDRYRMPYDRDVTVRTRCTAFGASVNDVEFLLDPTGARRFWPVEVTACNPFHGIDLQQLWAQVFVMKHEGYAPAEPEIAMHGAVAERHRVVSYAESLLDEVRARMTTIDESEWTFASAAEIGKYYKLEGNTGNWRVVGRMMRQLLGEPVANNGKKGWRVPIRKHEFTSGYVAYNAPVQLKVVA